MIEFERNSYYDGEHIKIKQKGGNIGFRSVVDWYEDGIIKSERFYLDSKQHGMQKYYWPNGVIEYETTLFHGKWTGLHNSYYKNGRIMYSYFNNDMAIDKTLQAFDLDGTRKTIWQYKIGVRHGAKISFCYE